MPVLLLTALMGICLFDDRFSPTIGILYPACPICGLSTMRFMVSKKA